ncbi:MAG: hypothetical protein AABY55_06225 [Candidatus Omnitrophota bacterium]
MKNKILTIILIYCALDVAIIGWAYPYALRNPVDKTYQRALEFLGGSTIEDKNPDFQSVKSAIENAGGILSKAARICGVKRPLFARLVSRYDLSRYPEEIKIARIHSALKQAGRNLSKASKIYYGRNEPVAFRQLLRHYGLFHYDEAAVQSILIDVFEGKIQGSKILAEHLTILKQFYIEGLDMETIASNLGKSPGAIRVRIHRDRNALYAWLYRRYNIHATRTKEALTALRKPVQWISGYRDWLNHYEEWLKNPANNQPDTINFNVSEHKISQGFNNFCRKHLKIPIPNVVAGQIIPRFDPDHGFLLEIKDMSGTLQHRYLMADILGRKMESFQQGSLGLPLEYKRYYAPGTALGDLLWHNGPVDLLLAFKPRHVIVSRLQSERVVKSIVFLRRNISIPVSYPFDTIIPDVSGYDLARNSKTITLYEPSKSETGSEERSQAVMSIMITESEDGSLNILTKWLGHYGDLNQVGARTKISREIKGFLKGRWGKDVLLPSYIVPVRKVRDRHGYEYRVVNCMRPIIIPAGYSDNSFLLAAFYSSTGEPLLGIWQPASDPGKDPPVKVLRLRNGKYEQVYFSDKTRCPALSVPGVNRSSI